jgi:predicted nuclease of predicted toxin-antitoxin system
MQFKIDENLPIELAELLINAGYDAQTANDQRLQGTKDSILMDVCKSENRILVTLILIFPILGHIHQKNFLAL